MDCQAGHNAKKAFVLRNKFRFDSELCRYL
jgi:hypothetical protein